MSSILYGMTDRALLEAEEEIDWFHNEKLRLTRHLQRIAEEGDLMTDVRAYAAEAIESQGIADPGRFRRAWDEISKLIPGEGLDAKVNYLTNLFGPVPVHHQQEGERQ